MINMIHLDITGVHLDGSGVIIDPRSTDCSSASLIAPDDVRQRRSFRKTFKKPTIKLSLSMTLKSRKQIRSRIQNEALTRRLPGS